MRTISNRALELLSSLGLSCVLLLFLGLLTWLGTLEQVEYGLFDVQKRYFESFFLLHSFGPVTFPLPGANLVLTLLFINLMVGGVLRLRRGAATIGVLTTHLGIALLLVAGFVKMYYSQDGHLTLYPTEQSNEFQSYYRWEIAVSELPGRRRAARAHRASGGLPGRHRREDGQAGRVRLALRPRGQPVHEQLPADAEGPDVRRRLTRG